MKKKIANHLSLLVIIAGAGSFFLSNVMLKGIFDGDTYGHYSLLVSYFSLIYIVGILGADQVFIRFSTTAEKNHIKTQKEQFLMQPVIVLISSVVSTLIFKKNYPEVQINTLLLFSSTFAMIGTLSLFSILRLNANFVLAQMASNYWKLAVFVITFWMYIKPGFSFSVFVDIFLSNIILIFLLCLFYVYRNIKFEFNTDFTFKQILHASFHFFLSIISAGIILFFDRFIIEMKYDFKEFGNFFYLTNFFLAPYSILQSYVGFKQLIFFKHHFTREYYNKFNRRTILFGVGMGVLLFCAAYASDNFKLIHFEFKNYTAIILILLFTGTLRLYSSAINSAFEARASIAMLRKSNLYILAYTITTLLFVVYCVHSIEFILLSFITIWFLRCFIHNKLLFSNV